MTQNTTNSAPLRLRLIIALAMLVLGFVGVIVTDVSKNGAWNYWRFLAVVYGVLSLCLSWHLRRKKWKTTLVTLWHEFAHWAGLIGAIFVSSYFVQAGLVGRFEASIMTLLLLALATFLAGIYIESTLLAIGAILGLFALGIAFIDAYFYNILLPFALLTIVVYVVFIRHAHKKMQKSIPETPPEDSR